MGLHTDTGEVNQDEAHTKRTKSLLLLLCTRMRKSKGTPVCEKSAIGCTVGAGLDWLSKLHFVRAFIMTLTLVISILEKTDKK